LGAGCGDFAEGYAYADGKFLFSIDRILDEFRGLRWMPLQPKHLDYRMTQVLLIGEGQDDVSKALGGDDGDGNDGDEGGEKNTAEREMEKLEAEDEHRVEGLKGSFLFFSFLFFSFLFFSFLFIVTVPLVCCCC